MNILYNVLLKVLDRNIGAAFRSSAAKEMPASDGISNVSILSALI